MIYLHVHTNFSLLQGTIRIDDLINTCEEKNIKSIALTDTNAMNGLIQFVKKAKENEIQPILGTCLTDPEEDKKYVILLAKNNEGYSDICRIITQRKLNDDFSLIK
ncbi:MAG TPA: PHP domain-containing protein, partial [Ignavibacteriaceae bacterium]